MLFINIVYISESKNALFPKVKSSDNNVSVAGVAVSIITVKQQYNTRVPNEQFGHDKRWVRSFSICSQLVISHLIIIMNLL